MRTVWLLLLAFPTLASAQGIIRERIVERDYAVPPVTYRLVPVVREAPPVVYEVPVRRVYAAPVYYAEPAPVYLPVAPSATYEYGPLGRLRRVTYR